MRIERHPAVIHRDLPDIYAFIARDSRAAAERVLDAVESTFELLTRHPECGVLYPARSKKICDVRLIPVSGFNQYLVFYRVTEEAVRILYVVHGARHLPRLFSRENRT